MMNARNKGFTLVEMLVAVSLFTVAVTIALGALLVINNAYRVTRAQQVAIDNLNFAIESMTRSIRTGFSFDCDSLTDSPDPNSCASGGDTFSFQAVAPLRTVQWRLSPEGRIQQCTTGEGDAGCEFVDLTSPDVVIETLTFYVLDAERQVGQPRVVIVLRGEAGRRASEMVEFGLQNSVTARN